MISFAQLLEQLEKQNTPLMTSGEDGPALAVVKAGKELRGEGESSFWDEFISLCSNSDGLADLFGVSKEKINSWPARISEYLDKIEQSSDGSVGDKEEKEVMPTGDTGAFTTNQDPNLGAIP
jgi:hypothetical protein